MRWYTGLLVENATLPTVNSGVSLINRGSFGSGHGWTVGWSVIWNSKSDTFIVQSAPGTKNRCIGCVGLKARNGKSDAYKLVSVDGIFDSQYSFVSPSSLYFAQQAERQASYKK